MTAPTAPRAGPVGAVRQFGRVAVPSAVAVLEPLAAAGVLEAVDVHAMELLASTVARYGDRLDDDVIVAGALACAAARRGDVCIDLAAPDVAVDDDGFGDDVADAIGTAFPDPVGWAAALTASPVVATVEAPSAVDDRPLVLWGQRLYTQRQWVDECLVGRSLRERALADPQPLADPDEVLARLAGIDLDDGQRRAVATMLTRRLAVVLGGPGTGKTFTAGAALGAAAAVAAEAGRELRVALAAPTGKAAARLTASVAAALATLRISGDASLPAGAPIELRATTIHRLLGSRPGTRSRFRHDAANPLPVDVVVIDESSMVALPLMARLVEALPADAHLVLVGDPHQLESIDVGAVLGSLATSATRSDSVVADSVVTLSRRFRGAELDSLAAISEAVRLGDPDATVALLRAGGPGVRWIETDDGDDPTADPAVTDAVLAAVGPALRVVADADGAGEDAAAGSDAATAASGGGGTTALATALALLDAGRVLCAHRAGSFGVAGWNAVVARHLATLGSGRARPVLVTRNLPALGLVNGDVGVAIRSADGIVEVWFPGSARPLPLSQLEGAETAWATTVHKSQGSEYDVVAVIHPPSTSRLARRELLYTAVTRVKRALLLVGSEASLRRAVETAAQRRSGLGEMLRR